MTSFYDRTNAEGGTAETEHDRGYIAGVEACMPIAADADALVAVMLAALRSVDAHFHNTWSMGGTVHKQVQAAIANAEGL